MLARIVARSVSPRYSTEIGLCVCLLSSSGVAICYVLPVCSVDNVIFARNKPHGGISIPLQQATSLRRRAQANASAVWYWLRRVMDDDRR